MRVSNTSDKVETSFSWLIVSIPEVFFTVILAEDRVTAAVANSNQQEINA